MTITDNAPRDGMWIEVEDGGAYTVHGDVPLVHKPQVVSDSRNNCTGTRRNRV